MLTKLEAKLEKEAMEAAEWADVFSQLEMLDEKRNAMLAELKTAEETRLVIPQTEETETAFEQLAVYFVYRHLADSLDDGRFIARVQFAVQSYRMIKWISAMHLKKYGNIDLYSFM